MKNKTMVSVLGSGAWGTALACVMARNGKDITLWGRDEEICKSIANDQVNEKYLPNIKLAEGISTTTNIGDCVKSADIVLSVVPVQATVEIAQSIKPYIKTGTMIVLCSKGINRETAKLPSEIIKDILPECEVSVLTGPSFAKDVSQGLPTAITLAHEDIDIALKYAQILSGQKFRIYALDDPKSAELAGALKNVVALAVGITRGLKLGASAEAAVISRGYAEANRLAIAMGAKLESLFGLAGLGDLVLSCTNTQSRNFSYGIAIGEGKNVEGMPLAEGAKTVFMAHELAKKHGLDCPIITMVKLMLEGKISPKDAQDALLSRPLKVEI